jgi:hypothetical protein
MSDASSWVEEADGHSHEIAVFVFLDEGDALVAFGNPPPPILVRRLLGLCQRHLERFRRVGERAQS